MSRSRPTNPISTTLNYNFPDNFYHVVDVTKTKHGDNPPGDLDVNCLAAGQPAWLKSSVVTGKKPNTLIFANLKNGLPNDPVKTTQIMQAISAATNAGFKVYLLINNQLIQKNDIASCEELSQQSVLNPKLIKEKAVKDLKQAPDQISIVDSFWMDTWTLKKPSNRSRQISYSEYTKFKKEEIEALLQAEPPLKEIVFNEESSFNYHGIMNAVKQIPVKLSYKINAVHCSHKELKKLEELNVMDEINKLAIYEPADNFFSCIKQLPNLKDLTINGDFEIKTVQPADFKHMARITKLCLSGNLASAEYLNLLLKSTEILTELSLSLEADELNQIKLEPGSLKNLRSISIAFDDQSYQSFIPEDTSTEEINIEEIDDVSPQLSRKCFDQFLAAAPNLTSIKINGNISSEEVIELLKNAPELELLDLTGCSEVSYITTNNHTLLTEIVDLNLSRTNITGEGLVNAMRAATRLERLDLKYCHNIKNVNFGDTRFPNLKRLDLSSSNISATDLNNLLSACPNLKTLNLNSCKNINLLRLKNNTFRLPEEIKLQESHNYLSELDLSGTNITPQNLDYLLAKCPNLKVLKIYRCNQLAEWAKNKSYLSTHASLIVELSQHRQPLQSIGIESKSYQVDYKSNKKNDEPFEFKGENTSLNQAMISDKLSQFLTLISKDRAFINKIQDGMCRGLADLFLSMDIEHWDELIKNISVWDGREQSITESLRHHFNNLYRDIQHYQFNQSGQRFIGDAIDQLLSIEKIFSVCLGNNGHAIALKRISIGKECDWIVYDSNFPQGYKTVNTEEAQKLIKLSLGSQIRMSETQPPLSSPISAKINDTLDFIRTGGILSLVQAKNPDEILSQMSGQPDRNSLISGLLFKNIKDKPAWLLGLESKTEPVRKLTVDYLKKFIKYYKSGMYAAELACSLESLKPEERLSVITLLRQTPEFFDQQLNREKFFTEQKSYGLFSSDKLEEKSTELNPIIKICAAIEDISAEEHYEKLFQTWRDTVQETVSALPYAHAILSDDKPNYLIKLESDDETRALQAKISEVAESIDRPVINIKSPQELKCMAKWIKRTNQHGRTMNGPGGRLYDFVKRNESKNPVFIVNFDKFSAKDIARFNTLLDPKPSIDGIDLPANSKVIGMMNTNKPGVYQGSDFYSRFKHVELCPVPKEQLIPKKINFVLSDKKHETPIQTIKMYNQANWKSILLGSWKMQGDELVLSNGLLKIPLQENSIIEIDNGPWDLPEFKEFWQDAFSFGKIEHEGVMITVPRNIQLKMTSGYIWNSVKNHIQFYKGIVPGTIPVLNPTKFSEFFERYDEKNNKLYSKPGIIDEVKNKVLEVNLTRTLSDDLWAKLLDECRARDIQLIVHYSPETAEIPNYLKKDSVSEIKISPIKNRMPIINSTDIDVTVYRESLKLKSCQVIDVSECNAADLLEKITAEWLPDQAVFHFTKIQQALLNALNQNKHIILKGRFSAELVDMLAPLLIARSSMDDPPGKLVIINDNVDLFKYLDVSNHTILPEEKKLYLDSRDLDTKALSPTDLQTKSVAVLEAIAANEQRDAKSSPWEGMHSLDIADQFEFKAVDYQRSRSIAETFTEQRILAVKSVLAKQPYAFITGLTGIGKSTFIENDFKTSLSSSDILYHSENNIKAWASNQSETGQKILFIDEANLTDREWSEFEGLFSKPPGMLIDGVYYPLTNNHKVIFAGNPVNYGDERRLAPFFERHGNAVLFKPLPPEFIYENVLKPIFIDELLDYSHTISDAILEMYKFINSCSKTEVLCSPRELQMVALLTVSSEPKTPAEVAAAVSHFCYVVGKNLVPQDKIALFNEKFRPAQPFKPSGRKFVPEIKNQKPFLITDSREQVAGFLDDLLALRAWRRNGAKRNPAQAFGGLGGIILEGEPAAGKSELVIARLRAHGYIERKLDDTKSQLPTDCDLVSMSSSPTKETLPDLKISGNAAYVRSENKLFYVHKSNRECVEIKLDNEKLKLFDKSLEPTNQAIPLSAIKLNEIASITAHNPIANVFYRVPVGMDIKEKQALLLKAFHEGAIVIIDEINCAPMMERLMNSLLMGKDLEGNPPIQPGFMLFGTQNPVTMAGRVAPSNALARRLITSNLPSYPLREVIDIVSYCGLAIKQASELARAYITQLNKAITKQLSPAPTLRDVTRQADQILEHRKKAESALTKMDVDSPTDPLVNSALKFV